MRSPIGRSTRSAAFPAAAALAALGASAPIAAAQWTVLRLHPEGFETSHLFGVTPAEQAGVVWIDNEDGGLLSAAAWSGTSASFVNLAPPGAIASWAWGAANNTQVGFVSFPAGGRRAFLWHGTAESGVDLTPLGASSATARAAFGDRQVGFTNLPPVSQRASLWSGSAASWVDLHPPGATGSLAIGVDDEQVVGAVRFPGTFNHACVWAGSPTVCINLHPEDDENIEESEATAVHRGQQVGWTHDGGDSAALWSGTPASWINLDPPGTNHSQALGVADGQQVGWINLSSTSIHHAVLWIGTAESMVDLHSFLPTEFTTSQACAIRHDDTSTYVAGFAYNSVALRHEAVVWVGCRADFDADGTVAVPDIFAFLAAWFSQNPAADFDSDRGTQVPDIFRFLSVWFAPC